MKEIINARNTPIALAYVGAEYLLNENQKKAYECILERVEKKQPGAFFIDGPGGTGKTFLYNALLIKVWASGLTAIPTAASSIGVSNLPFGQTVQSRFKLPLDNEESSFCHVPKQSVLAQLLRETSLFIWDEAPMAKKENVEAVDILLQDLCSTSELFGGKIIVFGGDFWQVLLILPRRTQEEAIQSSLVTSHLWPLFENFHLIENMRSIEDPYFSNFLLKLGDSFSNYQMILSNFQATW